MIAFSVLGFPIYWYGIFYGITFLGAYFFLYFIVKKALFSSLIPNLHLFLVRHMDDVFLYSVLGVLVGGRLGHIFIYDFTYYLSHPLEIVMLWKGGMSFIGGIIGVVSSLFILMYKYKLSLRDLFSLGDILFIPTSFGIMIGRIGNFLNQELYGIPVAESFSSTFPQLTYWASKFSLFYVYPAVDKLLRINTNFLSSFFEGFLLLLVLLYMFLTMRKKGVRLSGYMVGIFVVWYSFVRFFLEYLRADSQLEFVGFFTKSQRFFLFFALFGIAFLVFRRKLFPLKQ